MSKYIWLVEQKQILRYLFTTRPMRILEHVTRVNVLKWTPIYKAWALTSESLEAFVKVRLLMAKC